MWLSRLRIQICHHSGLGRCYVMGLIPVPETSTCRSHGPPPKKKNQFKEKFWNYDVSSSINDFSQWNYNKGWKL